MRKKIGWLAVAVASASLATACSSSPSGSSGGGSSGLLGIVESSGSDVTTVQAASAASSAAKAAGWSASIVDSQSSVDKANAAIQALVTRKAAGIMTTVYASDSLSSGIAAATRAGIPVVSMGGGLAPGVGYAQVANAGDVVTKRMIQDMGGGSKGSVLALTYHPGLPCLLRGQSFDQVMKAYPNVKVTRHEINVQSALQDSASTMTAWLATKPTPPLAVFACYDDPAIGAVSAIKQAGIAPDKILVYGFNAQQNALDAIKAGYMTASMFEDTAASGRACFKYLQKIKAAGKSWKPLQQDMPHELVDRSNLAAFEQAHPQ